jgi:hypothetical protein
VSTDSPEAHRPTERADAAPVHSTSGSSFSPGDLVDDRYELKSLLGAGGQGEVWQAEDRAITGHVVALKLLRDRARSDKDRDESLRELRMLAAVSHPSVVQFKDHGWFAGRLWFVMPWYEGKDLESSMPLTRAEARRVFEALAGGLAAVHAKGLRHQDIKPSNVLLAKIEGLESSLPVLLDFGVAAKAGEELVAGSPDYFAPELASGWPTPAHVGPEADVFALALTLRNALEPSTAPKSVDPFDRASLADRGSVLVAPPSGKDLAYLAPHFARWLAVDPAKRPTAAELVGELAVLTAPEERSRERTLVLRRALPWAAAALVLVSVLGWLGWSALIDARKTAAAEAQESEAARIEAEQAAHRADDLGAQLGDAMERASSSSARSEEALARLTEAEASIDRAEGSAEQLRSARDRLRAALADARREISAEQQALADTQASIARLTSDLAAARQSLVESRAETDAREGERDTARSERDTARSERDGIRTERDSLTADLAAARAQQATTEASLASARTELESERTGRAADRTAAEAASAEATDRQSRLEARVATLERQLAEARAEPPEPREPIAPTPIAPTPIAPPSLPAP